MAEVKRQDGAVLHFLKEMPAWVIVGGMMLILIGVNIVYPADFLPRLIDQAFGGLLTALFGIARRASGTGDTPPTEIKTDTLTTGSINDSTVTAETLNTGEHKPEGE